jgi:peptide/nickel transport system substrate-binding protein
MKHYLGKFLFLSVIATLLLAACAPVATPAATAEPAATTAPDATSAPTTPASTDVPTLEATQAPAAGTAQNTLVFATNLSDLSTLDPATMYAWSGILTLHNLYQSLVLRDGNDLKPGLAEKWDIKESDKGWDITFTLRDGGKFASGNPITADDVVFSYQRAITLKKGPSFLFTDVAGLKEESIKAADPKTVVISLPKSYSPQVFLSILTFTIGSVIDSRVVKSHDSGGDLGSAWLNEHSAGSGAYILDHWTKEVEVLLTANPNYAGTAPAIPNVLLKHVLESTNQQFGLEKGEIDIARSLSPEQIIALKDKPGVATAKGNSLLLVYVGLNQKVKELANPKVAEALRSAVDYDGIINGLLNGNALKVQTLISKGLLGYNEDAPFQKDVAKAKQLLKDAGYENGFNLELTAPTGNAPGGAAWSDIAAKLQADFADIGVTLTIKQIPYSELYSAYRAGTFQLISVEWGPDYEDPDGNILPFVDAAANSIGARNGWDDKAIAEKARAASLVGDPSARAAAYKDITEYVLHNGPYIVLYQPTEQFGLRDNIKGFEWKAAGWVDFSVISK